VLSIQAPTALPDPTGIAAIIGALQNGNMFRDMSGMAQTAALAQAALQASAQGATAVGQQAAQNLETEVSNQTERMRIGAQLLGQLLTGGAAVPVGATGSRPAKNATEEGGRLNYARSLDERNGGGESNGPAGIEPGKSDGGVIGSAAKFAGDSGGGTGADTTEETLFDRLTGGPVADATTRLISASADDLADFGDGGGGGAAATSKPRTRPRGKAVLRRYHFGFGVDIDDTNFRNKIGGQIFYSIVAHDGQEFFANHQHIAPSTLPFVFEKFQSRETRFTVRTLWLPVPGLDPEERTNGDLIRRSDIAISAAPPRKIPKDFTTYVNFSHVINVVLSVVGPDPVDLDLAMLTKGIVGENVLKTEPFGTVGGSPTKYLYKVWHLGDVRMNVTFSH
jgi:hypothetical protein